GAMLRRNSPLPAGRPRHRLRVRAERVTGFARDGERRIAREPLAPVEIRDAERLPEQEAAEAGAVDEERAGDAPLAAQQERLDVAALPVALDVHDQSFDALDAAVLRIFAEQPGDERCVEMI